MLRERGIDMHRGEREKIERLLVFGMIGIPNNT